MKSKLRPSWKMSVGDFVKRFPDLAKMSASALSRFSDTDVAIVTLRGKDKLLVDLLAYDTRPVKRETI